MIWRLALTVVLLVVASAAGMMGAFSPMLADDPRNVRAAQAMFYACVAVALGCLAGIVATWWRMAP